MTNNDRPTLRDLADVTSGPSGSLLEKLGDEPDGVPVVTPTDIVGWNQVDARKLRRLPNDVAQRLKRFRLEGGDIVLVRQGSLGRLTVVGPNLEGALYNSSCARVRRRDQRVLPEYLGLYLSSPAMQEEMLRRALPGTVQSLNAAILGSLPVKVPPIDRQHDVVAAINDIDELARIHRATADRLDLLKRTVLENVLDEG
ncbi:restriction endonuclease subunit S [Nocardia otitidiscaviarum]|uniref:restriction endonuclease subunit S n=1 Tax=Nocardia otitidiscaviarum TaxID=1823 RepID=UPI0018960DEA|nr:restriction endonuclease subunit S [Nocardia otitidiscaviarum]MBF6183324.1 restriction endonuclease subunit S [Nocardia otitidiscaviarum]